MKFFIKIGLKGGLKGVKRDVLMKFLKVWLGQRLASSISYLSWAGPFLKNAELDLIWKILSWAEPISSASSDSSASSAHQIYNSGCSRSMFFQSLISGTSYQQTYFFAKEKVLKTDKNPTKNRYKSLRLWKPTKPDADFGVFVVIISDPKRITSGYSLTWCFRLPS